MKYLTIAFALLATLFGCDNSPSSPAARAASSAAVKQKIAVLLVNHGSHSKTWRQELLNLEKSVRDRVMKSGSVKAVRTAFMEYNEPSIATRLREFDKEGFSDVILVPIFLAVSTHSFDDIPTIIGKKADPVALETLKVEKIERYTPNAKVHITPLLDFAGILKRNVLSRVQKLSQEPQQEGLVLIAYGDKTYEKEWAALLDDVAKFVEQKTGINEAAHGWCGHLVHYNPVKTTEATEAVLAKRKRAIVIPILVAHDENFQIKIIGGGVRKVTDHEKRVLYKPDAILPDANVEQWVVDVSAKFVKQIGQPE